MLRIEIDIPRPKLLVFWVLCLIAVGLWVRWLTSPSIPASGTEAIGGRADLPPEEQRQAAGQIIALRGQQEVLAKRADILRYQLGLLDAERAEAPGDDVVQRAWADRHAALMQLLDDQRAAERELTDLLAQMQEEEEAGRTYSRMLTKGGPVEFSWPVEPALGISAVFHDADYQARFGLAHNAIDIPIEQGSVIYAAADGVVVRAQDRGMGYNSVTLSHAGGYATLYGHVSGFLVRAGDTVRRGDPIARSGGAPHTPGAGLLTTGPHLHFEVFKEGTHIDPQDVLPAWEG